LFLFCFSCFYSFVFYLIGSFISVCTDVYPALSLMHEEAEDDVLLRRPRRIGKDRLVDGKLLFQAYM